MWEKHSCISITAEARGAEEASGNKEEGKGGEGERRIYYDFIYSFIPL